MILHHYAGGCHCGNIALEIELTDAAGAYRPRACDCDFCRRHAAAYLSDPRGSLALLAGSGTRNDAQRGPR